MIILQIDKPTPTLNRMTGRHWSHRKRVREEWGWLVKHALRRAGIFVPTNWAKATLTLERHGHNKMDAENCRAGFKYLIDSLVAEKIITNDTMAVIGEPVLLQFIDRKNPRTIVRIEAI